MSSEALGTALIAFIPGEPFGCLLLGAGIGFTFVYVATLAMILTCHMEDR
ncbi:MAG: hypothetical protein KGS72_25130 [Cyanobacteria bacterium REEB67]|nr:hypothetical protein [Cyanobacteria bacterium REEB67]